METRAIRIGLLVWTLLVVLFLWLPLVLIGVYAFNKSNIQSWPIPGWTTHWFSVAWHNSDVRSSLWLSVKVGLLATGFAPVLSTALVAGGLLAFALSFDEIIVTTFTAGAQTTLPIFILDNLRQGQQFPIVNVVAFAVILLTTVPVVIAQRLTRETGLLRRTVAP